MNELKVCFKCGDPVEGNLMKPHEVTYKCSACVQGQVEWVFNRPEDYPEAHLTLPQIKQRIITEKRLKRKEKRNGS